MTDRGIAIHALAVGSSRDCWVFSIAAENLRTARMRPEEMRAAIAVPGAGARAVGTGQAAAPAPARKAPAANGKHPPGGEGARRERTVTNAAGRTLAVWESGQPDGSPVLLLHGLTMTGGEVLKSTVELERNGFRVIAYDARGHGRSQPASERGGYTYELLLADLLGVMDALAIARAVLVGVSMGSHTALRLALERPGRVAALAVISPAYDPVRHPCAENIAEADDLAAALREHGLSGASLALRTPPGYGRDSAVIRAAHTMMCKRLGAHRDLAAVADALQSNLRSKPFESLAQLNAIEVPTLVVGSHDQFDIRHPFALARAYAQALPSASFACEQPGRVPLAWGGRRLTGLVARVSESATW